jgi:hypothetical protein
MQRVLRIWKLIIVIVTPHSLYNTAMGRLKQNRPSAHSYVEYIEVEGRRGPVVRERVIPSSPLKRRASASPSKTRNSSPNTGDYPSMQDEEPPTPKRIRIGQKVSKC